MIALQMLMGFMDYYEMSHNLLLADPTTETGPIVDGGWTIFCPTCKEWHRPNEIKEKSDLCEKCHAERYDTCPHCGDDYYWEDAEQLNDGTKICPTCLEDHCFECECCTDNYHKDEKYCNDPCICEHCYDREYFTREHCRDVIHNDNYGGEDLCTHCFDYTHSQDEEEEEGDDTLNSCVLPEWTKLGKPTDQVWLGVELELECEKGTRSHASAKAVSLMKRFCDIKYDGSLDNGFEMASLPATLEIHRREWSKLFEDMPDGVAAEYTCGMHVHLSRAAISPLTLGKMIVFYNNDTNRKFIQTIAGRKEIYNGSYDSHKKVTEGKNRHGFRYQAVNINNDSTIEIRVFAATTDEIAFLGRIDFAHAVLTYCRLCGINELTHDKFVEWVRPRGKAYPWLMRVFMREGIIQRKARKAS